MHRRFTKLLAFIFAPALFAGGQSSCANELAVGKDAKLQQPVVVPLNLASDLNFKSRDAILEMRFKEIARNSVLIKGNYEPSMDVFGDIEDGKPWWGMAGATVYGAGEKSIVGPAEESRFILNPLLLVGLNSATAEIWRSDRITEEDIGNRNFPYFWAPANLQFDPSSSSASVEYNVGDYLLRIIGTGKLLRPVNTANFSLVAYNARDFGYDYIYLDTKKSTNVTNMYGSFQPVRLRQFIHCGGSCGYPGGCNNMSPFTREIDRLVFTDLPAKLVVYLWKRYPGSIDRPADFTMNILLR